MNEPGAGVLRVALVEDEAAHAEAIRRAFADAGSLVEITAVGSLKEFRELIAATPPDIALMDLNLPDGRAMEMLTTPPEAGAFPILVMTSYGNQQVAVEAIKAGALDYVAKSAETFVDMPHIMARVMREWYLLRDRATARGQLRESEEQYRGISRQFQALLDAIPEDITVQTPDLKVIWANRAAALKMGKEPAEMYGLPCHLLRFGRIEACDDCPLQESLRTMSPAQAIMTDPAGRIFEARAIPVIEDERIVNVINVVRDITEQTQLEERLRQAQKMESIGTLAGGVAHEFNNILTSIIGYGHLALYKAEPDALVRPYLQSVLDSADRAAKLTDGLLAFSRRQLITKRPVNVVAIVRKAESSIARVVGEDVRFTTTLPAGEIMILADANQIEQVLMNLATNARDAMPLGGTFTVAVARALLDEAAAGALAGGSAGTYAVISATDTGTGMTDGIRQRIFEPFYTTKEVGKGTGLGLSIIHGIVKQHDGFVDLEAAPGKGTTFRIFIPAIASPEVRAEHTR